MVFVVIEFGMWFMFFKEFELGCYELFFFKWFKL